MAKTKLPAAQGGVPPGGSTNDVLTKASATDNDVIWQAPPGAGSGLTFAQTLMLVLIRA
jgi:hypothetical protein